MNMRTASADGAPEPCRCAPCNPGRMGAAVTPLLIVAIVALNYIPSVLFALDMGVDAATVALVVVFQLLLGLMIVAWSFTCATDPGVPPERWQRQMAGEAAAGREVPRICAKSGLYKPPRSHYCSVTGRLTLNMDHFCPWVVNTVGFYNRKFFVLFLFYTLLSTLWVLATFVPTFLEFGSWAVRRSPLRRGWTPTQFLVTWMALLVDGTLALMLLCFFGFHFHMVLRNTTTIEASARGFDVGWRKNLESVMGTNPYLWFVPIWGTGPAGDGVHWERKPESGELRTLGDVEGGRGPPPDQSDNAVLLDHACSDSSAGSY